MADMTEEELEKFPRELTSILQYVDLLKEVDTKNVAPTAQVTGQTNAFHEDVMRKDGAPPDALLACSPLPLSDHQILSPPAHG